MIPPDRPVQENEEIEITPEMIEAGVDALYNSGAIEHPLSSDELLVEAIFRGMIGNRVTRDESL